MTKHSSWLWVGRVVFVAASLSFGHAQSGEGITKKLLIDNPSAMIQGGAETNQKPAVPAAFDHTQAAERSTIVPVPR